MNFSKNFPKKWLLHVACLTAMFVLATAVASEKWRDRSPALLDELQFSFENAAREIRLRNLELLRQIEIGALENPSEISAKCFEKAKTAAARTDSMHLLLEDFGENPSLERAAEVQSALHLHRSKLLELVDFEEITNATLPRFEPADWLFQSLKNGSRAEFRAVVEQAQVNLTLAETACLNYFASKVQGSDTCCFGFQSCLLLDTIGQRAGEQVAADFFFGWTCFPRTHFRILLDGRELARAAVRTPFQVRFDSAGLHPLRFSLERMNWRIDSVETWEKTYLLNVQEK